MCIVCFKSEATGAPQRVFTKNQKTWKALHNFNGSCEVVVRLPWFNNCLGKSLFMLFDDISSFT